MDKCRIYYCIILFFAIKCIFGEMLDDFEIKERIWREGLTGISYVAGCSTFQDGSLRLFIVRKGLRSTHLKQTSILENGTVFSISLDSWGLPMGIQPNTMSPISRTNVLFAYANGTEGKVDSQNLIQKDTWAGISDEQGNLLYHVLLMGNNEFNEWDMFGVNNTAHQLVANIDTFIYVYYKKIGPECNTIEWKVFDDKAKSIGKNHYDLEMKDGCVHSYNTEPTLDGGFMIAWSVMTTPSLNSNTKVYAVFLNPKSATRKTAPFVIFSSTDAYEINILACAGSVIGNGFNCFLQALMSNSTREIQSYQVNFLSSGMIHNVVPVESQITNKKAIFGDLLDVIGIPLQYGGFLLVHSSLRQNPLELLNPTNSTRIQSVLDLFRADGSFVKEKPVEIVFTGGVCIFHNNTVVLTGISRKPLTLSIFTIDFPKFYAQDNGYQNLNIYSSYPALNEQNIPLTKESPQFRPSLTYRGDVKMSGQGLIKVFQANNDGFPRLTIPPNSINLINLANENENFTTINFLLFYSTLNMPKTQYYITVEDGMVETDELAEPLPGIKPTVWNFTTKKDPIRYSEKITVLLRFNPNALPHFIQDSVQTIKTIKFELSTFIPVNSDRLSTSKWYFGKGNDHSYILLPIQISRGYPSSLHLAYDLDDLILNLQYTNLRNGSMTNYLDSKYGAKIEENFFIQNMIILILSGCVFIVVGILYIIANIRDGDARNFAIPQFSLILSDFSLDLLFVVTHSQDIPFLFVPSLIFTVVPFALNFFWSVYIIIVETMYNDDFLRWFKLNNAIATTFTIIASTEVEVLRILNSRAGGFQVLQAPWSHWASHMIFMGSVVGFVIEDVPQFVIQVIYELNTASYSIIPFLTLVTSSLVILHSIVGKLYLGIAHWKKSKHHNEHDNNDKFDKFDNVDSVENVGSQNNDKNDSKERILLKGGDKSMRVQIVESDARSGIVGEVGYIEGGQESEESGKSEGTRRT